MSRDRAADAGCLGNLQSTSRCGQIFAGFICLAVSLLTVGRRAGVQKAAPRFELGMRILQTLALPLGHAAGTMIGLPKLDYTKFHSILIYKVCPS